MLISAIQFWQIRYIDPIFASVDDGVILVAGDYDTWNFSVRRRCQVDGLNCRWSKERMAWVVTKPLTHGDDIAG